LKSKMRLVAALVLCLSISSAFGLLNINTLRLKVSNRSPLTLTTANLVYDAGAPAVNVQGSKITPSNTLGWEVKLQPRFSLRSRGPIGQFDILSGSSTNAACSVAFDASECPTVAFCQCTPASGLQCLIKTEFHKCTTEPGDLDIQVDIIPEIGLCSIVKNVFGGLEWGKIGLNQAITSSSSAGPVSVDVTLSNAQFSTTNPPGITDCAIEVQNGGTFALQLRGIVIQLQAITFAVQQTTVPFVKEQGQISAAVSLGVSAVINFNTKKVESTEIWFSEISLFDVKLNTFQPLWNLAGNKILDKMKSTAGSVVGQQIQASIQACVGDLTSCLVPKSFTRPSPFVMIL